MASLSASPASPVFSPGLLFSHDWRQLHTPRGLLDTSIEEIDSPTLSSYQTLVFPITNAVQFEAFVHGLGRCDVDAKKNCPLQIIPGYDSENTENCGESHLSAKVKMVYKVTHKLSQTPGESSLSDDVIKELQDIEYQTQSEIPNDRVVQFLRKFGSHFPQGVQRLGKCFSWMVVVEGQCNMDLLGEIAEDIFVICSKYETHIPGSHDGIWYSVHNVLDATSWSEEKKRILQSARLCVAHHGTNRKVMSLTQWKLNDFVHQPVKVDPMSDNLVPVWDLIENSHMKFQISRKLASLMKKEWKQLAEAIQHHEGPLHYKMTQINIPHVCWGNLLDYLEMKDYFPAKLTLQDARSLHVNTKDTVTKQNLPWKVLNQVMLLNSMCREEDVSKFSKGKQETKMSFKDLLKQVQTMKPADKQETIPHPMDMTLLIFMCSDFMLRQVLAKKLFTCCLAVPFIVPTSEDTVEILLWPLRSIVMEWCNTTEAKEETLVKSKLNMVTFMRFGQTHISKSKMMNTILSRSSHDTFFHRDTPCGDEKRQISNGTVEVSHFLPSASETDHLSEPALFFNLRGDACDYPVQHSLLMELATVHVILLDLQELQTKQVQKLLCDTLKMKYRLVVILTDCKSHGQNDLCQLLQEFSNLFGDALKYIEIVNTFEDGKERNATKVNQEVRDSIRRMMVQDPPCSLEDFAASTNKFHVDETEHHCQAGKMVADKILSDVQAMAVDTRKQTLLPTQGDSLHEAGKLLRELHRSAGKETSFDEKEEVKKKLEDIKKSQASASVGNRFIKKVISMFQEPAATKGFAIQWVKMELDAISRTVLPKLHSKKNQKWNELMKAKDDMKDSVPVLKQELIALEKEIDAATFGLEHIMREIAHLYDVSVGLRQDSEYDLSSLPDIVGHLLLEGHPVELMDGDHGFIPLSWVKAVFRSLAKLVGEKKIFVLSVMGIQSSGKSTLLNTLFGLEFAVSAGRCTKGIYAQLLPVAEGPGLPFDFMLVLDSEGLRAQELGQHNYEHDNELATLVIGLSDLALINMKGENVTEITDILQIVVLAFLRMKLGDSPHKKQCMFIHQNVSAVNAEAKLAVDRQKFQEQLNNMTQQASETLGLHQNITSFNHIISFDGQQDVVYFSDLWEGDPPMATVNKGYSSRAADTKQRILTEVSQNQQYFLTVSEFILRIKDIWKGVLSDDFIFNFRNSLAAKAYLDLERMFARLTMEMEEDLLYWVNTTCNVQMQNCKTEPDVDKKCTELNSSLQERITRLLTEKQLELDDFLEKHPSKEIIMQWKTDKKMSLQMFGEVANRRMHIKLGNMKTRRRVEVQQQQTSHTKEQDIRRQAIALAEKLRGDCPEEALEGRFDEMWNPWAEELIQASTTSHQPHQNVIDILHAVLWETMTAEGNQSFVRKEFEQEYMSASALSDVITEQDLAGGYISVKGIRRKITRGIMQIIQSEDSYLTKASEQANVMMTAVMAKVETICQQDIMFDPHHGRRILDFALKEVTKYNDQKHIPFSFTPQFRAMFGLRVAQYAAPECESMNQKFEEKYGMERKLKDYRKVVFKQFQNAVREASTEVTVSDDFCETIKATLIEHVKLQIDQQVVKELYCELGITKYDLITKMLDDIVQTRQFSSMVQYVLTPGPYATKWVKSRGEELIFSEEHGESKYKQFACKFVEETITNVHTSTQVATNSVLDMESTQYNQWATTFYKAMEETIPLDIQQLEITGSTVKDFRHFQTCLNKNLNHLEEVLKQKLCQATAESVTWATNGSPFWRVYQHLWGCQEICPLCREPCQYSDPNHTTCHSCIQHRPPGVKGTHHKKTQLLWVSTCNADVASKREFYCSVWKYKCRNTPHCTATDEHVTHPCREYKKFLPRWNIAPDPSGEATKFWQWAMCTFQDELVKKYNVKGVKIPGSWKRITEQEARDSLRVFSK